VGADGIGEADLRLVHAVGAALARAVEEEDDGPGAVRIVLPGQIDNVAVAGAVEEESAVEEPCVLGLRGRPRGLRWRRGRRGGVRGTLADLVGVGLERRSARDEKGEERGTAENGTKRGAAWAHEGKDTAGD
jgi:hypothetical protein